MVAETEIARAVRDWLELEGWETYAEVAYEGRIADIVATRGPETWIVECKAKRSMGVIHQAIQWKGSSTAVWVAVPKTKRVVAVGSNFDLTTHRYGLGAFMVDESGGVEIRRSPRHLVMTDLGIRSALKDAHKDFAEAGNAEGKRYTPFQELVREIRAMVEESPGINVIELTTGDYEAECLRRRIKQGAIKGLEVRQGGKVYPTGFNRHKCKQEEA